MNALHKAAAILLLGCTVPLTGCVYALQPLIKRGQEFSLKGANAVGKGMPSSSVQQLLGDPLLKTSQPDGEVWYYYNAVSARGCRVLLFGVIPVDRPPAST